MNDALTFDKRYISQSISPEAMYLIQKTQCKIQVDTNVLIGRGKVIDPVPHQTLQRPQLIIQNRTFGQKTPLHRGIEFRAMMTQSIPHAASAS